MFRLLFILGGIALLLLLEPDFGATVVLGATVLGMVFIAGVKIGRFVVLQAVVLLGLLALIYSSEYRWRRLASFLDPWQDPYGGGFQLTQALIAIGRGELFGVGLGASIQKHHYLPEAHTDFIFAIIAEELGLVGVLLVMGLFAILVWRAFLIGREAEQRGEGFAAYLAYGIGLLFALQSTINMGVNMGVLPTKGLTLPMLSYGGSSLLASCIALGLLLRIDWENRLVRETPEASP
jgi:cell division protein FtsW